MITSKIKQTKQNRREERERERKGRTFSCIFFFAVAGNFTRGCAPATVTEKLICAHGRQSLVVSDSIRHDGLFDTRIGNFRRVNCRVADLHFAIRTSQWTEWNKHIERELKKSSHCMARRWSCSTVWKVSVSVNWFLWQLFIFWYLNPRIDGSQCSLFDTRPPCVYWFLWVAQSISSCVIQFDGEFLVLWK